MLFVVLVWMSSYFFLEWRKLQRERGGGGGEGGGGEWGGRERERCM